MLQIVRKKLTPDELNPPNIRYNADCDCFQTTFDDGTTWVDNPGADPRYSPVYQAPPPTGDDPRCDGAARMTALLKDSNDASIHSTSAVQAYSAVFSIVVLVLFGGAGLLIDLIVALADLVLSIGTTTVDDAFTSDVYDQIKCIAYNHLNADGQFDDQTAWDAFQDEIGATFGISVVTTVLSRMFLSFGFVTLNNAASIRTETGDCIACQTCFDFDFTVSDWGFTRLEDVLGVPSAVYVDGVGWQTTYVQFSGSNGYRRVAITGLFPSTRVTSFVVEFTFVPGVLDNTGDVNFCYGMTDSTISEPYFQQNLTLEIPNPLVSEYDPFTDINHIELNLYSGAYDHVTADPGGQITITRIYGVCP